MAEDDKELKDQRVVTMMSPSELEAIDDWMFKRRIRSRGEAIRRLCQIGVDVDEHFPELVSSYLEVSREAMVLATRTNNDVDAMSILQPVHDIGQAFGKIRAAVLTMRQGETIDRAMADIEKIRQAYASQDTDKALDLMKAYLKLARKNQPARPDADSK